MKGVCAMDNQWQFMREDAGTLRDVLAKASLDELFGERLPRLAGDLAARQRQGPKTSALCSTEI